MSIFRSTSNDDRQQAPAQEATLILATLILAKEDLSLMY